MSICDSCIHDNVCGLEDNHEEGMVSCADRIPKDDTLDKSAIEILVKMPEEMYEWVNDVNKFYADYRVSEVIK